MLTAPVPIPTRLLVLGMADHDGTIPAGDVYDAAAVLGQSPEQIRSCLRRLVADGLFERHGSGRTATFAATASGRELMQAPIERARLAYLQDAGRGWDRRWRLVAYQVPEASRAARDGLRDRLVALGGAPLHAGLYVSPHPWHDEVTHEAKRLGVDRHLVLATTDELTVDGVTDPPELARMLWPVDEVAARYEEFLVSQAGVPDELERRRRRRQFLADSEFVALALSMAMAFVACVDADPCLPPELLPRPWPGRAARQLVLRSRRLALAARASEQPPALFRVFDQVVDGIT